jgi:hypothetical protein
VRRASRKRARNIGHITKVLRKPLLQSVRLRRTEQNNLLKTHHDFSSIDFVVSVSVKPVLPGAAG